MTNVPEFSVSDLALSMKRTLEETYGRVRVRGELGRLTFPSSGHMYGNLKDDQSSIDAICWRTTLPRLGIRPEEGMEVICTGKITTYPARSNYQLIIESMDLAGEGALLKLLEQRKTKLAAEGLFAAERKKNIPFLPQAIGVITSPTGAVIRDILHRIRERFPLHVFVWPVRVQGMEAADEVMAAIEGFQNLANPPDTLILARGGGSLEDLMPFNEERVVRAVANCRIPIISAVGHETDTTLVDYASDLRAPTPTAAAEFAVPVRAQLYAQVVDDTQRLHAAMQRIIMLHRRNIDALRLSDPQSLLQMKAQKLDHAALKLQTGFTAKLGKANERLLKSASRLQHPQQLINEKSRTLKIYDDRLKGIAPRLLQQKADRLTATARMLESLSFKSVLQRGYVVVRDAATNAPLTDPAKISSGQGLSLQFKGDQVVKVKAD